MRWVLVLCAGNSCRSQIAEGYLRHFLGDRAKICIAGVEVHGVNPKAISILKEVGIDISKQTSNALDEYKQIEFDFVITVCDNARENCLYYSSKATFFHYNFKDPAKAIGTEKEIAEAFRLVREEIKYFAKKFVTDNF